MKLLQKVTRLLPDNPHGEKRGVTDWG